MKDITVILIHYTGQSALLKALISLKNVSSRLKSIIVLHKINTSVIYNFNNGDWSGRIQYIAIKDGNLGKTLSNMIHTIETNYVMFLYKNDYIPSVAPVKAFNLPPSKAVLGTFYHNRNVVINFPLVVRTSLLREKQFLSTFHLPFEEALFPSWLSTVENNLKSFKKGLVRQTMKNSSTDIFEKQRLMQKYQLEKTNTTNPSLSILISVYNMETYVETAVVSCLLQNEQPDQLLVIDDGSTDRSHQFLQQWNDGQKVMVFNKKNGGKARALNELLPLVSSDFILELDADDWLDPDAVSVIKKRIAGLPDDVSVLYGNLRKWKQLTGDVIYKGVAKGTAIKGRTNLLAYRFPLGPRVYRTSSLRNIGGFPVIAFENGRLYEDVSVLDRLLKQSRLHYQDFTVYNVREHKESITKNNLQSWKKFLKGLKER